MDIIKSFKGCVNRIVLKCSLVLLLYLSTFVTYGQPVPPRVISTSLNNDLVEIMWEKSLQPNVVEYRVQVGYDAGNNRYSYVDINKIPFIDSSQTSVSFDPQFIIDAAPDTKIKGLDIYKETVVLAIKAIPSAGLESKTDSIRNWDSTIFLQASFDPCLAKIDLNWNHYDYNRWPFGTREYKIFYSADKNPFDSIVIPTSQNSYQLENFLANSVYKIYVAAIADNGTRDQTTSIALDINTNMESLPNYIHADYATNNSGITEVVFSIDSSSELKNYELFRKNKIDGEYESIAMLEEKNDKVIYNDGVDFNSGPFYYKLDAINSCNEHIRSSENTASTILMKATGEPLQPELDWNTYMFWINGVDNYQVERKIGDGQYEILELTTDSVFVDNSLSLLVENDFNARVCYRVNAQENNNPYGENSTSLSNEFCVELPVNIRFEYNAFTPGNALGNSTFGPRMDFIPDEFEFSVLDRGGHVVFYTNDPANAIWDGKYKGAFIAQGAYLYVVRYRVGNGKRKALRGGLVVAYP